MAGNANSGSKREKPWREALNIAIKRTEEETLALLADPKAPMLARAAARCVMMAASDKADPAAMKEIGDRLDGKPLQATEGTLDVTHHDGARDRLRDKLDRFVKPRATNGTGHVLN